MESTRLRFGIFELAPDTGKLAREGVPVRLQPQPAKVLALLVRRAGEVITREDLRREVWGDGTHVDFDRGLNFCIAQIRTALGDSAESPRYLQTIPKQGYRFIAPVRPADLSAGALSKVEPGLHRDSTSTEASITRSRFSALQPYILQFVVLVVVVGSVGFAVNRVFARPPTLVVIPFYNETGQPGRGGIAAALGDTLVARLAISERRSQLSVIGNAPSLRSPFAREDVQDISRKLGAEYLIIGQLKTDGARLRLVAHLIRVSDMKHLWANTYDDVSFALDAQQRAAEAVAAAVVVSLTVRDH